MDTSYNILRALRKKQSNIRPCHFNSGWPLSLLVDFWALQASTTEHHTEDLVVIFSLDLNTTGHSDFIPFLLWNQRHHRLAELAFSLVLQPFPYSSTDVNVWLAYCDPKNAMQTCTLIYKSVHNQYPKILDREIENIPRKKRSCSIQYLEWAFETRCTIIQLQK